MKTVYVIGPKILFDHHFADFVKGEGFYFEVGFKNLGSVVHSIDNELTMLEEEIDKFDPADLALPEVQVFTHSEWKAYRNANLDNWTRKLEI